MLVEHAENTPVISECQYIESKNFKALRLNFLRLLCLFVALFSTNQKLEQSTYQEE